MRSGRSAPVPGSRPGPSGREHAVLRGQGDGAGDQVSLARWRTPRPQGYVDGPVGAARLAELAGAVQGVDDPHPVGGQPRLVVDALFGQDGVVRAFLCQLGHQELVRLPVSGVPQGVGVAAPGAQGQQQVSGALGQLGCQGMVVKGR